MSLELYQAVSDGDIRKVQSLLADAQSLSKQDINEAWDYIPSAITRDSDPYANDRKYELNGEKNPFSQIAHRLLQCDQTAHPTNRRIIVSVFDSAAYAADVDLIKALINHKDLYKSSFSETMTRVAKRYRDCKQHDDNFKANHDTYIAAYQDITLIMIDHHLATAKFDDAALEAAVNTLSVMDNQQSRINRLLQKSQGTSANPGFIYKQLYNAIDRQDVTTAKMVLSLEHLAKPATIIDKALNHAANQPNTTVFKAILKWQPTTNGIKAAMSAAVSQSHVQHIRALIETNEHLLVPNAITKQTLLTIQDDKQLLIALFGNDSLGSVRGAIYTFCKRYARLRDQQPGLFKTNTWGSLQNQLTSMNDNEISEKLVDIFIYTLENPTSRTVTAWQALDAGCRPESQLDEGETVEMKRINPDETSLTAASSSSSLSM